MNATTLQTGIYIPKTIDIELTNQNAVFLTILPTWEFVFRPTPLAGGNLGLGPDPLTPLSPECVGPGCSIVLG